jgi:cytochrome b pre-mRNA-processing protein 3
MLKTWKKAGERRRLADRLFAGLAARAREPFFFTNLHVPDTIDGRFDLLTLHAWLVLDRLGGEEYRDLSQELINAIFVQFDESLRDLGVGDIGIGHRVKKMADAFYGRLKAYREAADEGELATAILRNIYRGDSRAAQSAAALAAYAVNARETLRDGSAASGSLDFGPIPERAVAA